MQWLNKIVDELIKRHHSGEIVVSSGVSPSGTYHLGTLREVLTAEAIARELRHRGRQVRHIHVVDDLDVFRKVPVDVSDEFEKYLGMPLCDVPAPDGSGKSYADYFLNDLLIAAKKLKLNMEVMRSHEKYRNGFFVPAIEKALANVEPIRKALEQVSGRQLEKDWTPVQILEGGYLKNRPFVSIDQEAKIVTSLDKDGKKQQSRYNTGEVKLNWRIDWPARWSLLGVNAEPFGRDHATKGGSYDTGVVIVKEVFDAEPPLPVPYNFINRTGDTKKMSKSKGDTYTAAELLKILPSEVVWYFIIRYSPDKLLFFDDSDTLIRLVDEFSALLAKTDPSESDKQLIRLCTEGIEQQTISNVPFSHLVASYQAADRDLEQTLTAIKRTEYKAVADKQEDIIKAELVFIDEWLEKSAPEEVKFNIAEQFKAGDSLSQQQKQYLLGLADKIEHAPEDADGEWFHKTIYGFKDTSGLEPKELFSTLYAVLINKSYGPRAGWFIHTLITNRGKEWLVKRLRLQG